tara:strand:+ start:524 stop:835 length:312 start_codon:yes stop_codon:yes gene_type:complete
VKIDDGFRKPQNDGDWGNILAYFDIRTSDDIIIKGCEVVQGAKGVFVGLPTKPYKDKNGDTKYRKLIWVDNKAEYQKILAEVIREFDPHHEPTLVPADEDIPF